MPTLSSVAISWRRALWSQPASTSRDRRRQNPQDRHGDGVQSFLAVVILDTQRWALSKQYPVLGAQYSGTQYFGGPPSSFRL